MRPIRNQQARRSVMTIKNKNNNKKNKKLLRIVGERVMTWGVSGKPPVETTAHDCIISKTYYYYYYFIITTKWRRGINILFYTKILCRYNIVTFSVFFFFSRPVSLVGCAYKHVHTIIYYTLPQNVLILRYNCIKPIEENHRIRFYFPSFFTPFHFF